MFVCGTCHKDEVRCCMETHVARSIGQCERCGVMTSRVECRRHAMGSEPATLHRAQTALRKELQRRMYLRVGVIEYPGRETRS